MRANLHVDGFGDSLFVVGQRVHLHPGSDAWMSGDRHGVVVRVTPRFIHVRFDKSGKVRRVVRDLVRPIGDPPADSV